MRAVPVMEAPSSSAATAVHRHTTHEHEHEFEPVRGLPEPLPPGERVLWQAAPDWRTLARECFHVRKLAIYFAALTAWRVGHVAASGADAADIAVAAASALALAGVAIGLAASMAWMSARTALYTITDRRVVMRVGIVLSATFNLPFSRIDAAGLHPLKSGDGDIALTLEKGSRIAYLHLWPHARPWQLSRPQPALRCVADAADAARILTAAWQDERRDLAIAAGAAKAARPMPTSIEPRATTRPAMTPDRPIVDATPAAQAA